MVVPLKKVSLLFKYISSSLGFPRPIKPFVDTVRPPRKTLFSGPLTKHQARIKGLNSKHVDVKMIIEEDIPNIDLFTRTPLNCPLA